MEVIILRDAHEVGQVGADVIAQHVRANPATVLGLATGSSPLSVYQEVAQRVQTGQLSLSGCRAFMLDEYVGLPTGHPESYASVVHRDFLDHVDLTPANVHLPDGSSEDVQAACHDYEQRISDVGGVDVQLLGIGSDGHLAFNEPGSSLGSRTRVKTLHEQTRRDNARFFGGDLAAVPRYALTQGIGTILDARHLVLLALGAGKAEAVHHMVEGAVSARWPASALQLHQHVTVLLDQGAASRLELAEDYQEAYRGKPAWQGF